MCGETGWNVPLTFSHCGCSQPFWLGSFQIR